MTMGIPPRQPQQKENQHQVNAFTSQQFLNTKKRCLVFHWSFIFSIVHPFSENIHQIFMLSSPLPKIIRTPKQEHDSPFVHRLAIIHTKAMPHVSHQY